MSFLHARTRKSHRASLLAGVGAAVLGMSASLASADEMMEDPNACYLAPTHMEDGTMAAKPGMDELDDAYDCFEDQLIAGYGQSKHILAQIFGEWDRDSYAPFMYDDVGARYLVVYGNDRATGDEETLWLDRDLPVGATLAAAGFSVAEDGKLIAEPLMIYEKMTQGYIFGRGNWRQTLIAPNGDLLGVTNGPGGDDLTACADCLARSADRMYLALMNDGIMPADAPEPSSPMGTGGTGGEVLDPVGGTLTPPGGGTLDPLAPLDPNVPPSQTFDPNATVDPNITSDPLAPLDPAQPLDPNAPLDPLAPLSPLDTGQAPSDTGTDSLPPLSPLDEPLATLPNTSPLEEAIDGADSSLSESLSNGTDAFNETVDETLSGLDQPVAEAVEETVDALTDGLGTETTAEAADVPALTPELELELSDATDPLLIVPPILFEPPPYLELPEDGTGA